MIRMYITPSFANAADSPMFVIVAEGSRAALGSKHQKLNSAAQYSETGAQDMTVR